MYSLRSTTNWNYIACVYWIHFESRASPSLHTNEHCTADLLSSIFIMAVCRYSVFNILVILLSYWLCWLTWWKILLFVPMSETSKTPKYFSCFHLIFQLSNIFQQILLPIIFPLSIYSGCPFSNYMFLNVASLYIKIKGRAVYLLKY